MFRNKLGWVVCVLGLVCAWATGGAEVDADSVQCLKSVGFLTPIDSPDYRKYAPDREVQMLHLVLDVTPDFKQRTLEGIATLKFAPVAKPVRQIKLDGIDLTIQDVTSSEPIRAYDATEKNLVITLSIRSRPERKPPSRFAIMQNRKPASISGRRRWDTSRATRTFSPRAKKSRRAIGIRAWIHRISDLRRK